MLTLLEHYTRRDPEQQCAVGALMGAPAKDDPTRIHLTTVSPMRHRESGPEDAPSDSVEVSTSVWLETKLKLTQHSWMWRIIGDAQLFTS